MLTYRSALRSAACELEAAGIEEAKQDAWLLFEFAVGISRSQYFLLQDALLTEDQEEIYFSMIRKRKLRVPLQHITGRQEFMGLEFDVDEHVLIPRQDTELLVETAMDLYRGGKILDLCTGSGCVAISLAILLENRRAEVTGTDISSRALETAEKNNQKLCTEKTRVRFYQGDLFDALPEGETFDLIVANPPYIASGEIADLMPEVRDFEPLSALDGGKDGMYFYRRIMAEAPGYLEEGGALVMEIGCGQGAEVSRLLKESGFRDIRIRKDYAGLDRVVSGRKGGM